METRIIRTFEIKNTPDNLKFLENIESKIRNREYPFGYSIGYRYEIGGETIKVEERLPFKNKTGLSLTLASDLLNTPLPIKQSCKEKRE